MSLDANLKVIAESNSLPFWLPGNTLAMKFGAYMLRYQFTGSPVADTEVGPMTWRKTARTKFSNVNNVAVWMHDPSFDHGGWLCYAFTKSFPDVSYEITGDTLLTNVQNADFVASVIGAAGLGPLGDTVLQNSPTAFGQLKAGRLLYVDQLRPKDTPNWTQGALATSGAAHGGGFHFQRYEAAKLYSVDVTPIHFMERSGLAMRGGTVAWTADPRPGVSYIAFKATYPIGSQKVKASDPQSPSASHMGIGLVTASASNIGSCLREEWPAFQNRFLLGGGVSHDTTQRYNRPPVGPAWLWQPFGYMQGISPYVKHYAEKDGAAFLHLLWHSTDISKILTTVRDQSAADEKVQLQGVKDHFDTHPGHYMRALVWNQATKGPDIYTYSAIADALSGGASINDINDHVVDGKKLSEWRAICAAAPAAAVWAGITTLGDQVREAAISIGGAAGATKIGYVRDPADPTIHWLLPSAEQDAPVRIKPGTLEFESTADFLRKEGAVTGSDIYLESRARASLQRMLDARGKGEAVVDEDEFRFVGRSTELQGLEPWKHLGDLWWQHVRSKNMAPAVAGFVSNALQFAPSSIFGSGA